MTAATMPLRGPLRPRRSIRPLLVALGVIAAALALWWAVPAVAPPAYGPPPTLSESRMREIKAGQIGYASIRGMDVRASSGGVNARLFGGYLEVDRIILFLRLDPPGRPSPVEGTTLRDQFGSSLARHDPFGPRGLQRPPGEYVPWAMAAFFAIEAAAVVVAVVSAARSAGIRTGSAGSVGRLSVVALVAAAMLGFLVLTLPFAELMNACYIGTGFILRPQC